VRRIFPYVIGVGLVVGLSVVVRAWAIASGEAKAYEKEAKTWRDSAEVLHVRNEELTQTSAQADTIYVEVERETQETLSRAEDVSTRAIDSLRVRVDAVGDSLLDVLAASQDSIRDAYEARLDAKDAQLHARALLIMGLRQENTALRGENVELRSANAALKRALAPSLVSRIFDSWETHAAFAALGFIGGSLVQ